LEVAAIQGELFYPDEVQLRTDHEDLYEHFFDVLAFRRDEGGDSSMVGLGFTGESHEDDVVPAGRFDLAREQDSFRIGVQDNLEHRVGRVGFGAELVVGIERIETGEIQLVVDDLVESELEGPGQQLPSQIDGDHDIVL
jgi:hypothetical protein